MTTISEADAVSFVDARPRLLRIARRVLINPADADDVVQDAWVRWHETDRGQVRDPAAFLTTATTRLALNVRQSARARRESPVGTWTVDPVDLGANPSGAAEQVDGVGRALGMLLERLSATERAVYVLREAFDYPHRRIAEVLELSEANVRQIVTRARRRLAEAPRWELDTTAHHDLLDAFLAAARTGELTALEQVLAEAIEPRLCIAA